MVRIKELFSPFLSLLGATSAQLESEDVGVAGNRDKERIADPLGYGLVEYAYYRMARAAGIEITECRILKEGPWRHFMTRRFDRADDGSKLHMQTLCGLRTNANVLGSAGHQTPAQPAQGKPVVTHGPHKCVLGRCNVVVRINRGHLGHQVKLRIQVCLRHEHDVE